MRRLRTASIYLSLLLLTVVAIWLLTQTDKKIEGTALLISVFSLVTAGITLNQVLDSKLPDVLVEVTDNKRYNLLTLVVKNIGKMTAYNVQIDFTENPLVRFYHEKDQEEYNQLKYTALAPNNELVIALGGASYFGNFKDEQLIHQVSVKFNIGRKDTFLNRYKNTSTIDISSFRKTLSYPNEEIAAYKKVPDELNMISRKISEIATEISRPRKEAEYKKRLEEQKSKGKKNGK
ncbi:MAG: hypothetical protein RIG68_19695 [Imperialibacter sp.]|uniref:hypothetical protein n=1 Tax=Imperialibacter sp. TaxID=2038411 RepID=UPI0032EFA75C